MAVTDGVCEFCGQASLTGECDCPQAKAERKTLKKISEANEMIDFLFVEEAKQLDFKLSVREIALMKNAAELIANNLVKSVNIDFFGGVIGKLAVDASDNIKITRVKSQKATEVIQDK